MKQVGSLRTKHRFKKTEIGEIPVDWEVVSLEDAVEIIMGQSPPSVNCYNYENGLPFFQGNSEFGQKYPKILKWCNSPRKVAKKGDILISVRAPVGDVNVAPEECCIGRGLAAIRGIKFDNNFMFFVIYFFKDTLIKIGQGSTFEAINKNVLLELKIPFPPLSEQKKIAEILITIDEAIEKSKEIIEKTKELKRSLMQELLTRGIGHKKFRKTEVGEIPVEWGRVQLGTVVSDFINGGTPDTKISAYWEGNIPWITGADIENHRVKHIRRYITREGVKNSATNIIPKGCLLIVTRTGVGKLSIAPFDVAISQDITGVLPVFKNLNAEYLYWYIVCNSDRLKSLIQGTSINGLLRDDLVSFIIALPPFPEQKKIANILSSVDKDIEKEVALKERLEEIKKGLMQVLLTGKIRVKV